MNTPIRISLLLAVALLCGSCMVEPIEESQQLKINVAGTINQAHQTKATDSGFEDGDVIGIYAVNYENGTPGTLKDKGNQADNVRHTYDESENHWNGAYDIYFKDKNTPVDIIGYYPFSSSVDVDDYAFGVMRDQSKEASGGKMSNYEASDFLWGKVENVAPTSERIMMSFHHILSSIKISLEEGSGFGTGEWAKAEKLVTIVNTCQDATINLSTAQVTPSGTPSAQGIIPKSNGEVYRAVLIPQTIAAEKPLLCISINGMPYSYSRSEDLVFDSGRQYNFTMTVNKRAEGEYELVLSTEDISDWESDSIIQNLDAKEYLVVTTSQAGTLAEEIAKLGKDYRQIKHLKIVGPIGQRWDQTIQEVRDDWGFLRSGMSSLQSLNLKEAILTDSVGQNDGYDWYPESVIPEGMSWDYAIPGGAMQGNTTLTTLILPDKCRAIGEIAFQGCTNLSGSLVIPEGVEIIYWGAFTNCTSLTGTLTLPSTLKRISAGYYYQGSFMNCGFTGELNLPEGLTHIGQNSFNGCRYLSGSIKIPEGVVYIGPSAFEGLSRMTGSIEIPQGVTRIYENTFANSGFNGTLHLHDGIETIAKEAFRNSPFKGELILPKNLQIINDGVFAGCNFSGELVLPDGLIRISDIAFEWNWRLTGVVKIPDGVISIGSSAFANCRNIQGVEFGSKLEAIKDGAFREDYGIGSIVCSSIVPPFLQESVFDGVAKDNFTLQVPEASLALYQTQEGWRDFKRISSYANLVVRPLTANAINTAVTRELVLNADAEWEVSSKPEWVSLIPSEGNGKTEISLSFNELAHGSEMREGDVVFRLKGTEHTTKCHVAQYDYEYDEDQEIVLHSHTKGNGINLLILGDGYDASEVSTGQYLEDMTKVADYFFAIEPYNTYKEYFNVSTAIAVSPESGIGGINTIVHNKFGTTCKGEANVSARSQDYNTIYQYSKEKMAAINDSNFADATIIMMANCEDYAGIAFMNVFEPNLAYVTKFEDNSYDGWKGTINHEAGGHAFGLLGDEYIYHNSFIDNCTCTCCPHNDELLAAQSIGWFQNLSLSGHMDEVPWKHFIFHPKYQLQVDIFEGGFMHNRNVFRSEQNSCMNNNVPYYSAISREQIVKRIKAIAGEEYSFEEFVENDVTTAFVNTKSGTDNPKSFQAPYYHHRPVLNINGKVYGLEDGEHHHNR